MGAAHFVEHGIRALQQITRFLGQHLPGGGQANGMRTALQQFQLHGILQCLDLPTQRGLGQIQATCGSGDVALIGDSDEGAEVAEFHAAASITRMMPEPNIIALVK